MLSISKMAAGQENYYAQLAREDYYQRGGEPPGIWQGGGAAALGLTGQVDSKQLRGMFAGELNGKSLVQQQTWTNRKRQVGWDLTFSVPKSVSTAWSQAPRNEAQEIRAAHLSAVEKALEYVEQTCTWTRRGKGGGVRERCEAVFATYEHGTSRAQDPQLHTHALMLNVSVRRDGTTGALTTEGLYDHKMTAGAVYRAELARQLERRLGLTAKSGRVFEVEGVSAKLIQTFSTRRRQILARLKELGQSGAVASELAALHTRGHKQDVPRRQLLEKWGAVGKEIGWSTREFLGLVRPSQTATRSEEEVALLAQESVQEAIQAITYQQSTFTEYQLMRFAAEAAQSKHIGADAVREAVQRELAQEQLIPLGQVKGYERFTTQEILDLEEQLLQNAVQMKGRGSFEVQARALAEAQKSRTLNEEQWGGVKHLTSETRSVAVLTGDAGTGKTYMLDAAREVWERSGYQVLGAALAGKAARGLQNGASIESSTIHSLLYRIQTGREKLSQKTVLVVDEAGMVGTRQMHQLVMEACKAGAKLVLVGDEKQLQAIEIGGGFAAVARLVGDSRLKENMRQRGAGHRKAVADVAAGNAKAGLGYYAERGLLSVTEDRVEAQEKLLAHWSSSGGVEQPDEHLILAGRNVEVVNLNREAQARRHHLGEIRGAGMQVNMERYFRGDRIVFTRNHRGLGVSNGQFGTVESLNPDLKAIRVKLADESRRVTIHTESYDHFTLGYAVTTHKGQGMTTENAYVLADETMQDRELSYVQVSRARERTRIYTTRDEAGEELTKLAKQINRSRQKELAHDVRQRASRHTR